MNALRECVSAFMQLENASFHDEAAIYHRVVAAIHQLCAAILDAESHGISREEIETTIAPARALQGTSPFVARLQTWPRGYQGDYETMEYLCDCITVPPRETLAFYIEHHTLRDISAQQHRNKIAWQAQKILDTALLAENARILSIACGASRDLRSIEHLLSELPVTIFLNDMDADAINHSVCHLPRLGNSLETLPGNIFKITRQLRNLTPLHLIVAGGLFDYLDHRQIVWLLPKLFAALATGGRICFTNLAMGNPDRVWLEYIADWHILERSEDDIRRLIFDSGLAECSKLLISCDTTGITFLVEIVKTSELESTRA